MSNEGRMPLLEHLAELRSRLRNSVLAFLVTSTIAFAFAEQIYAIIMLPLLEAMLRHDIPPTMRFGSLTEPFWVEMKISIYVGIFAASPIIFYQLWGFISPGLRSSEKKIALPFAICSAICFIGGALFCYLLVFPSAFDFFLSYAKKTYGSMSGLLGDNLPYDVKLTVALQPLLDMGQNLDFVLKMLLAFGLVFELPLAIYFLSVVGLVTHRSLWKFNKYWVVISFVIGAILTPGPDVMSQILMAAPLLVLYQLSILISWVVTRGRERRQAAEEAAG